MSTKPTTATPRPKPSARPISIEDAARKRRERELDAMIERVRPAMERSNGYFLMNGIDPAALAISSRVLAVWNGPTHEQIRNVQRRRIF